MKSAKQPAEQPPALPAVPDLVGEALIEAGFVYSKFLLDINSCIQVPDATPLPAPWNLPSRLFQFPISMTRFEGREQRVLALNHPLLKEHPFVRHFEQVMEIDLPGGDAAEGVGAHTGLGSWWHAVDLINAGLWPELLASREFTSPENIAGAVSFALEFKSGGRGKKGLSLADARSIMAAIGAEEPNDHRAGLSLFLEPRESAPGRRPINVKHARGSSDAVALAWAKIRGIERGWFAADRTGYLGWTKAGVDAIMANVASFVFNDRGQGEFCFI